MSVVLRKETNLYDTDAVQNGIDTGAASAASSAVSAYDTSLNQTKVFNKLTNNGALQGLYMSSGQMYINASYIKTGTISANFIYGGTLNLGGSGNTSGTLVIKNASGTQIGKWDNTGISVTAGTISGNLITAGKISSANGSVYFDLTNNELACSKVVGTGVVIDISRYTYNSTYYGYQSIRKNSGTATSGICIEPRDTTGGGWITSPGRIVIHTGSVTAHDSYSVTFVDLKPTAIELGTSRSSYFGMNTTDLFYVYGNARVDGALTVTGNKNRVVETNDYGDRDLYCYETPSPLFGDVGEGVISDDGKCYVMIDSIFAETVSLNQYQVMLQKYGTGDCWVSERNGAYFIVEGTPGLAFGWEIKAKQSDFDQYRLEKDMGYFSTLNSVDYGTELGNHIAEIQREREVA